MVFHTRTEATRSIDSLPLFMLVFYFVHPPSIMARCQYMVIPSSTSIDFYPSEFASTAAALFFSYSKSRPACSHHLRDTLAPGPRSDFLQRPRIGHVAIYCATVCCLLVMYIPIPPKPASTIASSNGGYSQLELHFIIEQ